MLVGGGYDDSDGFFVQPTVIETNDPDFRLLRDELFGPVVTAYVYPEGDYAETLDLVDRTRPYGLTGAVFARDRSAIELAGDKLQYAAGNFYVNDKPTGAVVGQQPFGGARASGTNDKAGSMWNLIRWVSPRTIKETFVAADGLPLSVPWHRTPDPGLALPARCSYVFPWQAESTGRNRARTIVTVASTLRLRRDVRRGRDRAGIPTQTDPARNIALPCEAVGSAAAQVPRAAKNFIHVGNACEFVATDVEFQSRKTADGTSTTTPLQARWARVSGSSTSPTRRTVVGVGGYTDPGWENDIQVRGNVASPPSTVSAARTRPRRPA